MGGGWVWGAVCVDSGRVLHSLSSWVDFPDTHAGFLFLILDRTLVLYACDTVAKERLSAGSRVDLDLGPSLLLDKQINNEIMSQHVTD